MKKRKWLILIIAICASLTNSTAERWETVKVEVQMPYTENSTNIVLPVFTITRTIYYEPTEEERQWAYKMAFAEAGLEGEMGQILVINVAINHTKAMGYTSLIEEFTSTGRYSCIENGVPCIPVSPTQKRPVVESDLTESLKAAVDKAFVKDFSEELLKQAAWEKKKEDSSFLVDEKYYEGGAYYFYNPRAVSDKQKSQRSEKKVPVSVKYGNHVFYRYWEL
ncbi:MAG: hypothetical protein ACLU84_00525 [Clostridia bacterium]